MKRVLSSYFEVFELNSRSRSKVEVKFKGQVQRSRSKVKISFFSRRSVGNKSQVNSQEKPQGITSPRSLSVSVTCCCFDRLRVSSRSRFLFCDVFFFQDAANALFTRSMQLILKDPDLVCFITIATQCHQSGYNSSARSI